MKKHQQCFMKIDDIKYVKVLTLGELFKLKYNKNIKIFKKYYSCWDSGVVILIKLEKRV